MRQVGVITIGSKVIGTVTLNEGPLPAANGIGTSPIKLTAYESMNGDSFSPGRYGQRHEGGHDAPGAPPLRHTKPDGTGHWPGHRHLDRDPPAISGGKVYGRLAEARDRARQELKDKPWLNEKAMHIFAGENPDPEASTALWEETINRSAVRGTNLEKELRHTSEGGYFAGWQGDVSPKTRKVLEQSRDRALNHSNVSNYATDNASGGLAERDAATGHFTERTRPMNGERFFGPDNRIAAHQRAWHDLVADSEAKRSADQSSATAPATNNSPRPGIDPRVDPRIQEIVNAAATHLPEGYSLRMTSGFRGDNEPNHDGRAADYQIVGPNGPISNRGEDPTGLYTALARHAYGEQRARYPELNGRFAWGGAFGTQRGSGAGPRDLMHFDINGERGRYSQYQLRNLGPVPGVKYGEEQSKEKVAADEKSSDPKTVAP